MPPTLAAARKTYSGRSVAKRWSTAARLVRSVSRRVFVMRLRYPCARRARRMAEPARPVEPAMRSFDSEVMLQLGKLAGAERGSCAERGSYEERGSCVGARNKKP